MTTHAPWQHRSRISLFGFAAISLSSLSLSLSLLAACGAPEPEDAAAERSAVTALPAAAGWWKLDGNVTDSSGNGRHGTLSGGLGFTPSGRIGLAPYFDGVDDRIDIPYSAGLNFTSAMTVAAWVRPFRCAGTTGCTTGYTCCNNVCGQTCEPKTIANRWYGGDSWNLMWSGGYWQFVAVTGGVARTVQAVATGPSAYNPQNDWIHLAGVYDGAYLRLYVNGTLAASVAATGTLASSTLGVAIGNRPTWNRFYGLIDDVRLYGSALSAAQVRRIAHEVWPNVESAANSDTWLSTWHDEIRHQKPVVLALNFVVGKTNTDMQSERVTPIVAGLKDGARYHGYADATAEPAVEYSVRTVDMRTPPAGQTCSYTGSPACNTSTAVPHPWNYGTYYNSACYPRRWDGTNNNFKYSELFSARFAQFYNIPSPVDGHKMALCELVNAGMVHEVWVYGTGDNCDSGAYEVLEAKPRYDANRNKISPVSLDWCAGNGCYSAADQSEILAAPGCANLSRSVRIGFINYNASIPNYFESLGHGTESMGRAGGPIPYFTTYFQEFADYNLNTRYGKTFNSWYGFCNSGDSFPPYATTQCLTYSTATACAHSEYTTGGPLNDCSPCAYRVCGDDPHCCTTTWDSTCVSKANSWCPTTANKRVSYWRSTDGSSGVISNWRPACGNAHFASNGRNHYDKDNTQQVWTTCENWRLRNMASGQDRPTVVTNARWSALTGSWHQYWRQNFPGQATGAKDNAGNPLLSFWPFFFY